MMLEKLTALDYASKALAEKAPAGESWVIVDDNTTETQSAWIFFYNTQRSVETGSAIHKLAGYGPIFVNKMTGGVEFFGSTPPFEEVAEQYEARLRGSAQLFTIVVNCCSPLIEGFGFTVVRRERVA